MKSLVASVIAGVLAGVLGAWFSLQGIRESVEGVQGAVTRLEQADALRSYDIQIILTRHPTTNVCRSSTNLNAGAQMDKKVTWRISDFPQDSCLKKGDKLQIRFKDESVIPLTVNRPDGDRKIEAKVKKQGEIKEGTYRYAVYFIASDTTETLLEDPELDIWP